MLAVIIIANNAHILRRWESSQFDAHVLFTSNNTLQITNALAMKIQVYQYGQRFKNRWESIDKFLLEEMAQSERYDLFWFPRSTNARMEIDAIEAMRPYLHEANMYDTEKKQELQLTPNNIVLIESPVLHTTALDEFFTGKLRQE